MNSSFFIHPEDKEALEQLNAIPLVPQITKQVMRFYDENLTYGKNMGGKIRLSPTQLPHLYNLLPPICKKLGIEEPEFYLEMNSVPNAFASGENRPNITLRSSVVELMNEDELSALIAHECGHIVCHHMLYKTMVDYIITEKHLEKVPGAFDAAKCALLYWSRKSELSSDRVAAFATSPEATISFLLRYAGGSTKIMYDFNVDEYVKQVEAYDNIRTESLWGKTLQSYNSGDLTHPFFAVRVREILKWTRTEEYINLKAGIPMCPKCHSVVEHSWSYCKKCGTSLNK